MSLPSFASFLLPALRVFDDGQEHSLREVRDRVADHLQLTETDRAAKLGSGRTPVYVNRADWSVTYLHRAGLLERTARGVYRITTRGRTLLKPDRGKITIEDLLQFAEFQEFRGLKEVSQRRDEELQIEGRTPTERLDEAYLEAREALATELLDKVKQASPQFFEQLVLDLLTGMGYGGSIEDAASAVGRTGDGGIDGVIKEDKLGLDVVYVQAKRWGDRIVSVGDVRDFSGALDAARARKGVFITTSRFTQDAREYVQKIEKKIVLIDGRQLAELMIDHDVGVTVVQTYKLKRVDSDYFESE